MSGLNGAPVPSLKARMEARSFSMRPMFRHDKVRPDSAAIWSR